MGGMGAAAGAAPADGHRERGSPAGSETWLLTIWPRRCPASWTNSSGCRESARNPPSASLFTCSGTSREEAERAGRRELRDARADPTVRPLQQHRRRRALPDLFRSEPRSRPGLRARAADQHHGCRAHPAPTTGHTTFCTARSRLLRNIGPEDLKIKNLLERMREIDVREGHPGDESDNRGTGHVGLPEPAAETAGRQGQPHRAGHPRGQRDRIHRRSNSCSNRSKAAAKFNPDCRRPRDSQMASIYGLQAIQAAAAKSSASGC